MFTYENLFEFEYSCTYKISTMQLRDIFDPNTTKLCLERLNKLKPDTVPKWGKMNAPQMLAHLNVPYDLTYGKLDPKLNGFMKLMLKWFVKPGVVGNKPYKKNSKTAPFFLIQDERDFELEKAKLIDYINKTEKLGTAHFEGRDYVSFGKMSASEWSNLFYKHMNHHFSQFGI